MAKEKRIKRPDMSHIKTPTGTKAIPVGKNGHYALVDEDLYEELSRYNWCLLKVGYAYNRGLGYMHRYICKTSKGMDTDHIDHNKLNNTRSNMRVCSHKNNMKNISSKNKSKYKGANWHKQNSIWRATICINSKNIHLGCFDTEIEAAKAYDEAAKKLFGEFAYLNFKDNE